MKIATVDYQWTQGSYGIPALMDAEGRVYGPEDKPQSPSKVTGKVPEWMLGSLINMEDVETQDVEPLRKWLGQSPEHGARWIAALPA